MRSLLGFILACGKRPFVFLGLFQVIAFALAMVWWVLATESMLEMGAVMILASGFLGLASSSGGGVMTGVIASDYVLSKGVSRSHAFRSHLLFPLLTGTLIWAAASTAIRSFAWFDVESPTTTIRGYSNIRKILSSGFKTHWGSKVAEEAFSSFNSEPEPAKWPQHYTLEAKLPKLQQRFLLWSYLAFILGALLGTCLAHPGSERMLNRWRQFRFHFEYILPLLLATLLLITGFREDVIVWQHTLSLGLYFHTLFAFGAFLVTALFYLWSGNKNWGEADVMES